VGHFDVIELANIGLNLLAVAASVAGLVACFMYRRLSSAMALLIVAFVLTVVAAAVYFVLTAAPDFVEESLGGDLRVVFVLANLLNMASALLTALGLFLVFADLTRRLDRGAAGPPDDFGRRPPYDRGREPPAPRFPDSPDIRR
jgi:hypothetical protein